MPVLERGSVGLHYEESGAGVPPVVLLHGVCCSLRYMAPVEARLRGAHRVVAVDLRGHGRSAAPVQEYTIAGFADDVSWLCEQLGLERPVVIGHSMGGAVGLELAASRPDLVGAVVMLDTAVLYPAAVWESVQPVIEASGECSDATFRTFVERTMFLAGDESELKSGIVADMLQAPRHVRQSAFENIFRWDSEAAVRGCRAPVLYVGATHPRGDVARFHELAPQLVSGQVVESGHFLQLEVSEQVNPMIERFLARHVTTSVDGHH